MTGVSWIDRGATEKKCLNPGSPGQTLHADVTDNGCIGSIAALADMCDK